MNPVAQFQDAIRSAGLNPPDVIEPGRIHRFSTNGRVSDNAGWCIQFEDGLGGVFGDHRTGLQQTWQAKRDRSNTAVEREAFQRKVAEVRTQREAEEKQRHAEAAEQAAAIWKSAAPVEADDYLRRKEVKSHGLREHEGKLVVPLRDTDLKLHSLLFISADGEKRFLPGGSVTGHYFGIGKPAGVICICEGYATAASVHEATGHAVAVAFDAGNLVPVAKVLRAKYPDLKIILCADNDLHDDDKPNTGIEAATKAARAVKGLLAVPEMDGAKCDLNDLAVAKGADAVKLIIEKAKAPAGAPETEQNRIVALSIDELLTRDFPAMEPLLGPWLCKQHLSMVHAWRGVGKTHFALGVAYAVAGGGQFLKWKADKPGRVVYIDGEMAGAAIQARVEAIVRSTPDEHEPPKGFFHIITPDAQPAPMPNLASMLGQAALAPHIADADLIVVDNLSCLMRSGPENDAESWVPVAEWALELRRQGKAVLFVHHDGKSKTQRGTSKKEDIMDVVIKLDHAKDYEAEKGAAFTVEFEKARHLSGPDARDLEAALTLDEQGRQAWVWKDAEMGMSERILKLNAEAPDMTQTEIAEELGCNRSTVSRALKNAREQEIGGVQ